MPSASKQCISSDGATVPISPKGVSFVKLPQAMRSRPAIGASGFR